MENNHLKMNKLTLVTMLFSVLKCFAVQHKYVLTNCCQLQTTASYQSKTSLWMLDCVRLCSQDVNCQSATFEASSENCFFFANELNCTTDAGSKLAYVNKVQTFNLKTLTTVQATEVTTVPSTTTEATTTEEPETTTEEPVITTAFTCLNNGTLDTSTQTCTCYGGYIGDNCERLMKDCTEGYKSGHYNEVTFAPFLIKPVLAPVPFEVQCNMKDRGGVTFFMKNTEWTDNKNLNRNLNWNEYKNGFGGNVMHNHWIGLQNLFYITSSRPHHMYVEIIAKAGSWKGAWRRYENFKVEDESTNYRMTYSGSSPWSQSDVDADPDWTKALENTPLGDSMVGLNGSAFSTYDRDNDQDSGRNCAQDYKGGWWFNACADCNPNGPLKSPRTSSAVDELFWRYNNNNDELVFIEIMLRAI